MFLIDDVLKKALDYFFKRVEAGRAEHDASLKSIRIAMRALASSLSEIEFQLRAGVHRLRRHEGNRDAYFQELGRLVDSDFLNKACNESGICKELRIAQDELFAIAGGNSSTDLINVGNLSHQLDTFETSFVAAVREFLSAARQVDLTAVTAASTFISPAEVTDAFEGRLDELAGIRRSIDGLLERIRESSLD